MQPRPYDIMEVDDLRDVQFSCEIGRGFAVPLLLTRVDRVRLDFTRDRQGFRQCQLEIYPGSNFIYDGALGRSANPAEVKRRDRRTRGLGEPFDAFSISGPVVMEDV